MRTWPSAALLMVLSACGSPPEPPPAVPSTAPPADVEAVLAKLRAGEAPPELRYDKNPVWTAEIGAALSEDRPWKSPEDALLAVAHFAKNSGPDQLSVIEGLMTSDKSERRMRGIFIARLSPLDETRDLLVRHAKPLLDAANVAVAKVALGAMGHRRARAATEAILDYFEATDDPSALRALGRIWEGGGDGAMRTAVHLIAHTLTMGPAASAESADALLRVMSDAEVAEFLEKWVPEKFASRELVVAAAGAKGFDGARGRKIHAAFLKSPDPALVTTILWTSPHKLDPAAVSPLLDDERVAGKGAKVCDFAAARLEAIETGLPPELPADPGLRERRLKKWKGRR